MIKKRYITLLETLIALTLMTLLLSTLLGTWLFTSKLRSTIAKQEEKSFRELTTGTRLTKLLTSPSSPRETPFYFYTDEKENPALIFTYDNGTGQGPLFSNTVLGKLFVDKEKRLTLITWPSPERELVRPLPYRRETLLKEVKSIQFFFYFPGEETHQTLPFDNKKLPTLISLLITEESGKELLYKFLVANSRARIIYP